jgi:NADH dehydrogenase [ubiquinone] 1 alpha subcomplex assembly factor 7
VFGHCLCVWFVTQWQSPLLNKPSKIQLVELGPGRGTLITDILQLATASTLQEFGKSIVTVNLIEASRVLRKEQEMSLKERLGHLIDFEWVHVSPFRTMPTTSTNNNDSEKKKNGTISTDDFPPPQPNKIPMRIEWHDSFSSFSQHRDRDIPVFVIAQEFLDALPVHSFQKTSEGWRERLIDVASIEDDDDNDNDEGNDNRQPLASSTLKNPPPGEALRPRLRQVLAPDVTPAVQLLIEPNQEQYVDAPLNSVIEICPEAILLVQDIAKVLEESQGVALLIDYGQDGTADTLRAFSNHQQVPLTSRPGQVDVTADVDFFALRKAVVQPVSPSSESSQLSPQHRIHAFGPVRQGEFLMRMGIADMVIHSIEQDTTSPDYAHALSEALKYLVLPEYMGDKFKVLALAPKRDGIFAPAGME